MMKLLMTSLIFLLCACASSGVSKQDEMAVIEEIKQADRDFYAATRDRGIDGWVSFYAEDAARVDLFGKVSRGQDEIRETDTPLFANPNLQLRWEPEAAGMFADGIHGFTKGPFNVVMNPGEGEQIVARGAYLTIWRNTPDGWRVILDTGAPEPPESE